MSALLPAEERRAAREQAADDFVRNLHPVLHAIHGSRTVVQEKLNQYGSDSPEHKALCGIIDKITDMELRVREQVHAAAEDIAAGVWEPGERRQETAA